MNLFFPFNSKNDQIQSRLFSLAALFLFTTSIIISLAPSVRLHSWEVAYPWKHWLGFFIWLAGFSTIHKISLKVLPDGDRYIFPIIGILSGWGLLTIFRLDSYFGLRQTIWLSLCIVLLYIAIHIHNILDIFYKYKNLLLALVFTLTCMTIFFGTYPSGDGPHLWLAFMEMYLQPSEPLKLMLVIYLSAYLAENLTKGFSLVRVLLPSILLLAIAVFLLIIQRDLGTSYLIIIIFCFIVYLATGKKRVLVLSALALILASIIGYQVFDVIRIRVEAWINPWSDPSNRSFQIIQSIIAIASGGLLGTGQGLGSPGLVPLSHSDFIFTSICEETGLAGSLALILLYILLAYRGFDISLHSKNNFHKYLAGGLTTLMMTQSILIMGGNIRLLPLTGVTLPFLSYGGSSLVCSFCACIILALISNTASARNRTNTSKKPFVLSAILIITMFVLICIVNIWWGVFRASSLVNSPYNARPAISDRYIQRGDILFRNGKKVTTSIGKPGNYQKLNLYPPLNPVIGYTGSFFGEAGLQASLSPYLRGVTAYPDNSILLFQLLFNQSPPGMDVRTSLDPDLQSKADLLLGDQTGSIILLNARNGEILVIASHPYFDVNVLDEYHISDLNVDDAPLLNRAIQGQYPIGTAIAPFILAYAIEQPNIFQTDDTVFNSCICNNHRCEKSDEFPKDNYNTMHKECENITAELIDRISSLDFIKLCQILEFDKNPSLSLPSTKPLDLNNISNPKEQYNSTGDKPLLVSPIQIAMAASSLSENGRMPHPQLTLDYRNPKGEWETLNHPTIPKQIFTANTVKKTTGLLSNQHTPIWESLGYSKNKNGKGITWYIAGTIDESSYDSLTLVVVMEKNDSDQAKMVGETLLSYAIHP